MSVVSAASLFIISTEIRRIRKHLSHQTAIYLIHAFITSKLGYCNSLLYAFLLFTLIFKTSKSSKCCCQTCNQHPSHLSHYSCFKRSRGKIVNNVIGYEVNGESLAPQLTGTTASNTIKANKVRAL